MNVGDRAKEYEVISLEVSPRELRYLVSCGLALIQNVPEDSLSTYCGLSKDEIVDISMRFKKMVDRFGLRM